MAGDRETEALGLFRAGARKEPRKPRPLLRRPIHRGDKLSPCSGIDVEAGSIGKKPLRSLASTLNQKLRKRLALGRRGARKQRPIRSLDAKVDPFLGFFM